MTKTKDKITTIIFVIITIVALFFIATFTVTSGRIETEKVAIGPHNPTSWCSHQTLTASSSVIIKSENQFIVYDDNDVFVTSGTPGELVLGEKNPEFFAKVESKEGIQYSISTCTEVYATEETTISLSIYNTVDNIMKAFLTALVWAIAIVLLFSI